MSKFTEFLGIGQGSAEGVPDTWPVRLQKLGAEVVAAATVVDVAGTLLGFGGAGLAISSLVAIETGALTGIAGLTAEAITEGPENHRQISS